MPIIRKYVFENNKQMFWLGIIIYRLMMDWAYENCISVSFGYMGFINNEDTNAELMSWCILGVFLFFSERYYTNKQRKISSEIIFILFLLSIVPFSSMIKYGMVSEEFMIANVIYWLCIFLYLFILNKISVPQYVLRIVYYFENIGVKGVYFFIFLFSVTIIYVSYSYTGFRLQIDLLDVYGIRAEASEYQYPVMLSYILGWSNNLLTVCVGYCLIMEKYIVGVVCIIVQILNFGIAGHKSTWAFMLVVLILCCFIKKKNITNNLFIYAMISVVFICNGFVYYFGDDVLVSLFLRRVLYTPNQLGMFYYDYFSTHNPDWYAGSVFKLFTDSDYENISKLIANVYFGKPDMNANSGLIADAMANMGELGVILQPLLLVLCFKILDVVSKNSDNRILTVISIYVSLSIINSFLFTILFTHGLIPTFILLAFMNNKREVDVKK